MYKIEVHNRIKRIISLFQVTRLWQDDHHSGFPKWFSKFMHLSACLYYPIGLFGALLVSDNKMESMFMGIGSIIACVQMVRMYYFILKKDQIIDFLRTLGIHIIRKKELNHVYLDANTKIERFMKFASVFILMVFIEVPVLTISALPFISNGKHLPLNIYFPLNWKESEIVYWFAFGFVSYTIIWYCTCTISNVVIWYLMMSCAIKYEILGNELKNVGIVTLNKITLMKKREMFMNELIELIRHHQQLQDSTDKFKTIFSNLFFIQIITSGLTICGTLYAIAFAPIENPFEYVFYVVAVIYISFEIFMVTYFGNEIKIWSGRLSYCLFEGDWLDQSLKCKQCMIILMEVLKRSQVLIIGKLYPLDLALFTKILNFAYSMFNVLRSFKSNN